MKKIPVRLYVETQLRGYEEANRVVKVDVVFEETGEIWQEYFNADVLLKRLFVHKLRKLRKDHDEELVVS